jgi:putative transposase
MQAVSNLPSEVGRNTVARILERNGIEPAPSRRSTWSDFLAAHWDVLAAADFFTVEVVTWTGLVRYHVFFVMELCTRRVHVAGITRDPSGEWLKQIARNLTDPFDRFLRDKKYLILDRDPVFTRAFREVLENCEISIVRLPARSPNLNSYAERWVKSIRNECLDRIVPLGERSLRRAVSSYVEHYHRERNHQGLDGRLIDPEWGVGRGQGRIVRRKRLGGLLSYYYREAA